MTKIIISSHFLMRGLQSNFDLKNALKKIQIAKIKIKKREKIQKKIENKKKTQKDKIATQKKDKYNYD